MVGVPASSRKAEVRINLAVLRETKRIGLKPCGGRAGRERTFTAAFGSGMIFLLAGLPLALLVRRSPESMGLQPDGDPPFRPTQTQQRGQTQRALQETHFTLAESMRTSPFWYLTIGTALRIVVLTAVAVHYVPIMVWKGMCQTEAAFFLGAQSFLGIPATLLLGWLADRMNKAKLMAVCMLFAILSISAIAHDCAKLS